MRTMRRLIALATGAMLLAGMLTGCGKASSPDGVVDDLLDPKNPTTVTVWHYYNGGQQTALNQLVEEFNAGQGKELGIFVESFSMGGVNDLEKSVMDAVNGNVGAKEIPSIFAAYADTAYALDKMGKVVDLSAYLTQEEQDAFIDSYITEGAFGGDGSIKIFPVAKSTEVLMMNETDWDVFAAATGASLEQMDTMEGMVALAQTYHEWTDAQTAEPNDGKAFFGRDALANYLIIGARQLGTELFQVEGDEVTLHFDQQVARKLWDNYYIPFIKGYFGAAGRFRSDDVKTGDLLAFVGSSSSATFFPKQVVAQGDKVYDIQMLVRPAPQFQGGEPYAVQQGAGMVVTNTDEKQIYASVQFLKWFTQPEQNIRYSMSSGYLPVTKAANDMETIRAQAAQSGDKILPVVEAAIDTVRSSAMYTTKAFETGTAARGVLEDCMSDIAAADRVTVQTRLAQGMELEQAVQDLVSDEYFQSWYDQTLAQLNELCS